MKNNTRKRALLLHHAGERLYDIFETLEDTGESNDYNAAVEILTESFSPQKNTEHQILMFRKCYQRQSETLDQFQTRLQMLAKGEIRGDLCSRNVANPFRDD